MYLTYPPKCPCPSFWKIACPSSCRVVPCTCAYPCCFAQNKILRVETRELIKQNLTFDFELLVGHRGFNSKSDLAWMMPRGKLLKLLTAATISWMKASAPAQERSKWKGQNKWTTHHVQLHKTTEGISETCKIKYQI